MTITIRAAVEKYLKTPESTKHRRIALLALLGPVLDEPIETLTDERVGELAKALHEKPSPRTGHPYAENTQRQHLDVMRKFRRWCAFRGLLKPAPADPTAGGAPTPAQPKRHLGDLIRDLRDGAGLTRMQLGRGTKLDAHTIRNIEHGRYRPTRAQLDKLLRAPAMDGLLEMAEREGIKVEFGDSADKGESNHG
jgi:hypothetical protein